MINVRINGQSLTVNENLTVLQAAEQAGITIPTLCYHRDLTPFGGCRMCVVEIQGARLPATSCTMPVSPGMVVQTESPKLTSYRRSILELLLSNYYDAGTTRSNGSTGLALDTEFAYWVNFYGIDLQHAMAKAPRYPIDSDPNPFVRVDMNKCIQCTRCLRACAEVQGRFVWGLGYRGFAGHMVAGLDTTMLQARCESCGACVAYCPTGALENKMSSNLGQPSRSVMTTCSYCSVGCQFNLNVKDDVPGGRVLNVTSTPEAAVNGMHLCVKGRYGYEFIHNQKRLMRPRVRKYLLEGASRPKNRGAWADVDWDTALDIVSDKLQEARDRDGPDSIGLLTSGRSLNEEVYLMNKLARQVLGTHNIDCCAHLSHESTVDGLEESLGMQAQSNSLDDVANCARSMFIIGCNLTEQQPVFGAKIRQAVLRRHCKLVVAHPDFINMSEYAALRLVHKLGTDAALVNGLMYIVLEKGWEDRKYIDRNTEGFEGFIQDLRQFNPVRVAEITGVPTGTLYQAAEILAANRPMAVIWGVDLTQHGHGRANVTSLANLQLLLGNLGIPGGGVIPLRSQNNSQGACDMGGHPCFYPGYQPVESDETRQKFEKAWGVNLPLKPGMTAVQMIQAAEKGELKALYILGDDLVMNAFDSPRVRRSLLACELVILQGIYVSETSHYADIFLPGVSFAEKTGTFTNSERRIQMVRQAIEPQGETYPDWRIFIELANWILEGDAPARGVYASWNYSDTAQIMEEIARLTPIYAGVSHERLKFVDRLQWPVLSNEHAGTPILFAGQDQHCRGKFVSVQG